MHAGFRIRGALFDRYRVIEDRSIKDEGVKLAIFAARIDTQGEVRKKGAIIEATSKGPRQTLLIDAGDHCFIFCVDIGPRELLGVQLPEWKDGLHADHLKAFLAEIPQIIEVEVAEGYFAYSKVAFGGRSRCQAVVVRMQTTTLWHGHDVDG